MFIHRKFYIIFFLLFVLAGNGLQLIPQPKVTPNVKTITVLQLQELININKGHALLINVWATWCVPCRTEFPHLVTLENNYREKIRVIGISVDDADVLDSNVIPFLLNQKAEFENYIIDVVEPEDFINLLNKDWSGAIPATFLFDKNGVQKETLIGEQSYESFEKALKKVID